MRTEGCDSPMIVFWIGALICAGCTQATHSTSDAGGVLQPTTDAALVARRDTGNAAQAATADADDLPLDARVPVATGRPADAGNRTDAGHAWDAGERADALDAGVLVDASLPARGSVTIRYTTLDQGGTFSPRNVGAAWVEDSSGAFVKTLDRWAAVSANRLSAWRAASNGNVVDAVTSATAAGYGAREAAGT